jgi:hypothetical protein
MVVLEEARLRQEDLAVHTPVRTGMAQLGWEVEVVSGSGFDVGAMVTNRVTNRGYSYPTGLTTGTGMRAVPTTGWRGSHRADWPGMHPSTLHDAWESAVAAGFHLPSLLARL